MCQNFNTHGTHRTVVKKLPLTLYNHNNSKIAILESTEKYASREIAPVSKILLQDTRKH